jgi:GDSL-like Lipase/Acylhydrolase family
MSPARRDRPLSVAVFGASVTAVVCGPRQPGSVYLTYPAVLARQKVGGEAFDVRTYARIYGLVSDCAGAWIDPLAQTRPDVVVLQFGLGEVFPRLVPRRFVLALLGLRRHSGPVRDRLWRRARTVLLAIHAVERRVDPHLPLWWCRMSPRRFEHELAMVCSKVSEQIGSRLVLMTAYPPLPPTPFLNPRLGQRIDLVNAAIRRVADRCGATVFPLDEIVGTLGSPVLPDGLHMSVDAHHLVGEQLARCLVSAAVRRVA